MGKTCHNDSAGCFAERLDPAALSFIVNLDEPLSAASVGAIFQPTCWFA
jgi:hypothetical protein